MAGTSYFQKAFGDTTVIEGDGDAEYFENEAQFLAYYGSRLVTLLRETDLKGAAMEESTQLCAAGYPDGYSAGGGQLRGLVSESNMNLDDALDELDWRNM